MKIKHAAAFVAALLFGVVPARASFSYTVSVDTSFINTTAGFLDFQFNPGADSQAGFVDITNFATDGVLGAEQTPIGDVTGTLPGTVALVNDQALNDYNTAFTYGTTISFTLTFGGAVINSPNDSPDGSTFGFSLLENDDATGELTTNPAGFAFTIDVNPDGSTDVNDFLTSSNSITAVPEPGVLGLILMGFVVLVVLCRNPFALTPVAYRPERPPNK
jgi:hypothetical protein